MWLVVVLAVLGRAADPETPHEPPTLSGSGNVLLAFLPDDSAYPMGILRLDRGFLHLEARYDYEGARTGSVFGGANFHVGNEVSFDATPMLGFVFGQFFAVAPGVELDLSWRALEWYTEAEVAIDVVDPASTYLYVWSEFSIWPVDFGRFGVVVQRTRAYGTDRYVQPGLFVGLTDSVLDVTLYAFDLGLGVGGGEAIFAPPTFVVSVTVYR